MICVSIGRGRHRHLIAEHKNLVANGAELVELRLDYIQGPVNLKRLLDSRPCPVVVTVRREQDGGKWKGTEEARQMLLRTAIASGVEYVDLEEDVAAKIPRYGKTKRIVSHHDFRKTPENLQEIHERLSKLQPDVVKIATMANKPQDNLRMLQLVSASKTPTVGMCMGDVGTPSRILGGKFGCPFAYATFNTERALAPGQLSYQQMKEIYHYDDIGPGTEIYGVIGDPIGHSLSPVLHNAAFKALGLNKAYVAFRIPKEDLFAFIDGCRGLGVEGLSVTIPHKEAVLRKITVNDPLVQGIGAANTLVFDGRQVHGFNTDCQAALDSLEEALGGLGQNPSPLVGKQVMILGAGRAAKALAYGLIKRGADVCITSRTLERTEELADQLDCGSIDWSLRHNTPIDVLINCTPVGMHPNVDESPFEAYYLKPHMIVFDAVYNPENTLLVKEARQRNCKVVTGVDMFVRQAGLQFKRFTDRDPPLALMREVLKKSIGAAKF